MIVIYRKKRKFSRFLTVAKSFPNGIVRMVRKKISGFFWQPAVAKGYGAPRESFHNFSLSSVRHSFSDGGSLQPLAFPRSPAMHDNLKGNQKLTCARLPFRRVFRLDGCAGLGMMGRQCTVFLLDLSSAEVGEPCSAGFFIPHVGKVRML